MALGNGKTVVGLGFDGQTCRILVARGQAGQATLLGHRQTPLPLTALDQEETRRGFLAQVRPFLRQHGAEGAPAHLALSGQAASLHPWPAPAQSGPLKSWGQPPLKEMTPLPLDQATWSVRHLAGNPRLRQVALVPTLLARGLWDLAQETGLDPQGLDLAASHAALAAQRLAGPPRPCLCLRLDADEASWAWLEKGGVGLMGLVLARPGEAPLDLAGRAAQEAVNATSPSPATPIWLWGPTAPLALPGPDDPPGPAGEEPALDLRPLPLPPLPSGLEPADQPLWLRIAGQGAAPSLFALHPQAQAASGRWENQALTRRLAWCAGGLALALLLFSSLAQWWDHHQAQSALDQARARQQALKQERMNLRRDLGPQATLLQAQELRQQPPRLLAELAARLPQGSWLESLSCQGPACTLLVAGSNRQDLLQALSQDAPWRITSPPDEAGSRPGAGELLKVELSWEGEAGN